MHTCADSLAFDESVGSSSPFSWIVPELCFPSSVPSGVVAGSYREAKEGKVCFPNLHGEHYSHTSLTGASSVFAVVRVSAFDSDFDFRFSQIGTISFRELHAPR